MFSKFNCFCSIKKILLLKQQITVCSQFVKMSSLQENECKFPLASESVIEESDLKLDIIDSNNKSTIFKKGQYKTTKMLKQDRKLLEKERRRERKQDKKRNTLLDYSDFLNLSDYYFENGLRKVRPYFYTYKTFAKGRWFGQTLIDTVNYEFHFSQSPSFTDRINKGLLRVNDKIVEPSYIIGDNDNITHLVHRHELPVSDEPVTIVHEDDTILVVNKPASIPIHPCSRYNFNTLVHILAKNYGKNNLRSVHRLDRMTSGLMIFGKNYDTAVRFSSQISSRQVEKEYISLVDGIFPGPDKVVCRAPIGTLNGKVGIQAVMEEGEGVRDAFTTFQLISLTTKGQSLVRCWPHTGRTHQIRVHLQYLGHPIVNDPIYNTNAWGPEKGRNAIYHKTREQLITDLTKQHEREMYVQQRFSKPSALAAHSESESEGTNKRMRLDETVESSSNQIASEEKSSNKIIAEENSPNQIAAEKAANEKLALNDCPECHTLYEDPAPESFYLCLHAHRYKGVDWEFTAPWPIWANDSLDAATTKDNCK